MELIVDIKKIFSDFTLYINFECNNSILGVLGESGSGKSMTLRCIAGLITPDEGRIILNGRTLFDSRKNINVPIKERNIGFLFQNYALFPHMTVENNISYALNKKPVKERNRIVDEMLNMMQIENLRKRYPNEISGGQQQRAALARALAVGPEALLLDEPFSALDNHLKTIMLRQMSETLSKYKGATLFVTHNLEEVYELCEDLMIISKGANTTIGNKKEMFKSPPSFDTAKLLGYKNITKVNMISPNYVKALDWNCNIKLPNNINENIAYIGIKEHLIQLYEGQGYNNFNVIPLYIAETPFSMLIYLTLSENPLALSDIPIIWEVPLEQWDKLKNMPKPWKIHLNENNIMLINKKKEMA